MLQNQVRCAHPGSAALDGHVLAR